METGYTVRMSLFLYSLFTKTLHFNKKFTLCVVFFFAQSYLTFDGMSLLFFVMLCSQCDAESESGDKVNNFFCINDFGALPIY